MQALRPARSAAAGRAAAQPARRETSSLPATGARVLGDWLTSVAVEELEAPIARISAHP